MDVTGKLSVVARQVLAEQPSAPVRVRLLRDCLAVGEADPQLSAAISALDSSPQVRLLAAEQRADGSWGRFHTRDTTRRQKVFTTEYAVYRALALGLDLRHPLLARARDHCAYVLPELARYPDPLEKNDRVTAGVPMVVAGVLALIDPQHPALDPVRRLWIALAARVLASGAYSAGAEIRAHRELTGASVNGSYLTLSNRYALALLASQPALLPAGLEDSLLIWLRDKPDGIGYYGVPLAADPRRLKPGPLECWLSSLELLARFPRWRAHGGAAAGQLWRLRGAEGRWDLGPRCGESGGLPLSDSWRPARARAQDWTTRIACLLRALGES